MLPLCLSLPTIYLLLLALTASHTAATISFTPRVYCSNYPGQVAGRLISGRDSPSRRHSPSTSHLLPNPDLVPRDPRPIYWCVPSTRIYVSIQPMNAVDGPIVAEMLTAAAASIATHIHDHGDGVIGGDWNFANGEGLRLARIRTYDANDHHVTWGVLGVAVGAVGNWVGANGGTTAMLGIFDGKNQVGAGFMG